MLRIGPIVLTLLLCMSFVLTNYAARAEKDGITVELNKVEDLNGACRMSFVFTNRLAVAVSALSMETVLFDTSGSVIRFVVMGSRPLQPGKILVQQYDVKNLKCASLGRVLLNDAKRCKADGLSLQQCLARIQPTSRIATPFVSTVSSKQE